MNLNIATPSTRHRIAIKLEKNMVVRTIPNTWVNTTENIIIPISIHSAIHDDIDGYFKFCSMINVIKSKSAGKIIVLLSEGAHVNVINLQHQNNISQTLHLCRQDAEKLYQRYQSIFTGCEVTYWQDFIMRHANYKNYKNAIYSQIISNEAFKVSILNDLEKGYSEKFKISYPCKSLYLERALLDHVEMTAGIKIMYENKCRFLCYPGKVTDSIMSAKKMHYPNMTFINVGFKFT